VSRPGSRLESLLAGERRGPAAAVLRALLLLLTPLYRLALTIRRVAYALRIRRVRRPGVPVVSVGNLTAGGTGKTPFVALLVERLSARGMRPAVVSRGYRAPAGRDGDEARMLREAVPGILHVEDPDRSRGAARAAREGADVVVLDDGFQHWACGRDLDIVLVDALRPFGHGHLLPRGLLREPVSALSRADLLVITRADQVGEEDIAGIRARLASAAPGIPVAAARHAPVGLETLSGAAAGEPSDLSGKRVLALSGIGNPAAFERTREDLVAEVVAAIRHADHHEYAESDLADALEEARAVGAEAVVTTGKDAVKLAGLRGADAEPRILVLSVEMRLTEGSEHLDERCARIAEV
jgi:tetraacyldisaccharide 4'-kinase